MTARTTPPRTIWILMDACRGKRVARTRWGHSWRGLPCPGVLESRLLSSFFFPDPGHGGGVRFTCAHLPNPPSDAVFINAFRVLSIFYRAFCSMTWACSVPSGRTISIASGRCSFVFFFYPFQSASGVA